MSTVSRQTFDEVMVPNYQPSAIIPVRGAGSRVWDQEGREYVDFACGIAVTVLGHCHPKIVAALNEQANKLWHVSNVMTNEPALKLAQKLTSLTFADKAFFCNSGAEANEAAFKLARRHGAQISENKHQIIAFNNAFHGRTLFTVTVGGTPKYSQGFGPAIPGVTHLPYNDVAALEAAISDNTCAVVMEPIQGEGGVTPATAEFAKKARELCSKHNALLIFDEVQSGNARTGSLFAYQQMGVTPDILTTAKGLGGGFPIGAMLTTDQYAQVLAFGTHGSTYGGNALACAVALAVIEELQAPALAANVTARAEQMRAGLEAIGKRYGIFSQVRGMGMLIGAALNDPWKGKAKDVVAAGLRHGVWFLVAGGDVLRFAPALNISEADMAEGLKRMDAAVAELTAPAKAANG